MTEPQLDKETLEVVIEVILNDIEIPPQGRFYAIKAIQRMFPEQTPPWVELVWRIREAEKYRTKRLAKRAAKREALLEVAKRTMEKA